MDVDELSVILEASHPQIEKNMLHFFFLIWVIWQS